MSLESLKERNKDGRLDKLIKAAEKSSAGKTQNFRDPDIYYPFTDKAGNGQAIIRFLPGLESEDEPIYVEEIFHWFKGRSGKWYRENCPTFLNRDCPVCDANRKFVNENGGDFDVLSDEKKKVVRRKARQFNYFANILVVEDPANPENNGKIFKFRFGKKILEKIISAATPKFETQPSVIVYDYKEGANFMLVVKKVSGNNNYDDCKFEDPKPLTDKLIDYCKKNQFPLIHYTQELNYKDYMVLRKILANHLLPPEMAPLPDNLIGDNHSPDSGVSTAVPDNPSEKIQQNPFIDEPNDADSSNEMDDASVPEDDMEYFRNLAK